MIDNCSPSIDKSIIEALREDLGREQIYSCNVEDLELYVRDSLHDMIKGLSLAEKVALVEYLNL
jgi:hypothetical protein